MTSGIELKSPQEQTKDVNGHSAIRGTTLTIESICNQRVVNNDPMSKRIWLPSKSRIFLLCFLSSFVFYCLSLYAGVVHPRTPCFDEEIALPLVVAFSSPQPSTLPSKHSLIRDRLRFPRTRRRLPQCIIIGARKGGTRALLEFINLHPKIQKAPFEMHFFDDDDKYDYGLDWYRRHMPFSFPDQITVEKSPAYFITEKVPARIHAMNGSIKLLLLVREPVTRVISDYTQIYVNKLRKGKMTTPFEELALTPDGEVNLDYKAIRISMYDVHLRNWLKYFSHDQIHVVDGDKLITEPISELRLVEDFLGLKHVISPQQIYFNKTKGFYCLKNETSERCLSESKGRKHPEVDKNVVSKLREFYREHNKKFYYLTGKHFGWPEV